MNNQFSCQHDYVEQFLVETGEPIPGRTCTKCGQDEPPYPLPRIVSLHKTHSGIATCYFLADLLRRKYPRYRVNFRFEQAMVEMQLVKILDVEILDDSGEARMSVLLEQDVAEAAIVAGVEQLQLREGP